MAEVVNLRLARKAKRRAAAEDAAAQNRAAFGAAKGERVQTATQSERLKKTLDGAKRAPQSDPPK